VRGDRSELAQALLSACPRIDVLLNNAGIVGLRRQTTPDGLESVFATNHLAPFLLTSLLLPRLRDSAPARIVNVSSHAHRMARLDFDDLQDERRYRFMRVYGQSKLCSLLSTRELARRLEGTGVTVNALHPGMVHTGLGRRPWARSSPRS
jgi:retinol dehydrogenase-14